jgi:hypothetical protein
LTDFSERRILSAKNSGGTAPAVLKFCGRAGAQPSKLLFATRYSLLTIRCRFTIRRHYSLLAIRHSPFAIHHSLPFYHSPFTFATRYSPLAIRYSPVANRCRSQYEPRPPKFVHRKIWERGEEGEMACGKFGFKFDCK